jgi:hypothetical protein
MSSSLFSRPTPFGDSPAMHNAMDKCVLFDYKKQLIFEILSYRNKQKHACGKTIGLIIALVSYILALTLIIGDLFFDSQGN